MRVLHILSQRPSLTGSGITLDSIVRHASAAGWEQRVVVGVPTGEPLPEVGGLPADKIQPLIFGNGGPPFPVPGMSDVMPYPSTVFSAMTDGQISTYVDAWRGHLTGTIRDFNPQIIHTHHIWMVSSMIKDLAPTTPVVNHCHATGLRQMELVPRLAERVRSGCARNEAFVVLHKGHADELGRRLGIGGDRIHIVGAGYREDLFHPHGRDEHQPPALLYAGKFSRAKGLPWLLDAFDNLTTTHPNLVLHIAGGGSGAEAESLRNRMISMAPKVRLHGQLAQRELADLMRRSSLFVLPSFYEGLPLVLVEAFACGCRLVATDLPGVVDELAPRLGDALELVELPQMAAVDTPVESELPAFVGRLTTRLRRALVASPLGDPAETMPDALAAFTWAAVFDRIERVWRRELDRASEVEPQGRQGR